MVDNSRLELNNSNRDLSVRNTFTVNHLIKGHSLVRVGVDLSVLILGYIHVHLKNNHSVITIWA